MAGSRRNTHALIRAVLVASLLASMVIAAPAASQGCEPPPTPFNMTVTGHTGGAYASVEATAGHLLAIQGGALVSFDVTAGNPTFAGAASAPDPGAALYVAGDRAFAVAENRFAIYDVSDPGAPELLAVADMPSVDYSIVGFFATADRAYAGYTNGSSYGTKIFDITDPAAASVLAYSGLVLTDMHPDVVGQDVYAVADDGAIERISLAEPLSPVVSETFGTNVLDADEDGGTLYATSGSGAGATVSAYDITSPTAPDLLCSAIAGTNGDHLSAAGSYVWRTVTDGVELWELAAGPALVRRDSETLARAGSVAAGLADEAACVLVAPDADGSTALAFFESASVPGTIVATDSLDSEPGDIASALDAQTACIVSPSGLRIEDLTVPGMPVLGSCPTPATPTDVARAGSLALVATEGGLTVFDLSDPSTPTETDTVLVAGGLDRVVPVDDVAYAIGANGLYSFDLSDPSTVTQLDYMPVDGLTDVDARDNRVWVTQSTGETSGYIIEFDATDPAVLVRSADHGLPSGMPAVTVATETAFVGMTDPSWGGSAVKTFDIVDPGTLTYTNWIDAGQWLATDLVTQDGVLLTVGDEGVQQLGVYDPMLPYQMAYSPTPGERVSSHGEHIAVCSANGGTTYLRYEPVSFRTFGGTRFETAIAMSQTFESSEYVVLATGRSYPDALAGVPLAYALNAPILLTERESIPEDVAAEIERLGATKAIVLGGTSAVSENIVDQLEAMGFATSDIERISGATRYETARAIALRLEQVRGADSIDRAFVATGLNFPDALAAAGAAAKAGCPVLLVKPGDANTAARGAISALGVSDTVIVGGTSVVPADIAAALPSPERLSGANRYETAARIAVWSLDDADTVFSAQSLFVVTGTNFPDALACGVVAAGADAPTLLVGEEPPAETLQFIQDNARTIERVDIVGGDAAVSSAVEHWLVTYVK